MVSKISLLKISANAGFLKRERTAQEFIVAADAVFFKAQGLAMLVPLHEMAFGLLEGLLDDWCLLNLDLVEWRCKAEVCQACINLWSLNKQVPWCAEFRKTVVSWEHAVSTIEQIRLMHFEKMAIKLELTVPIVAPKTVVDLAPTPASSTLSIQCMPFVPYIADPSSPPMHGKGKAKVTEENKDEEGEATQKLRKELEDFVVPTKAAKVFLERQGKLSQFFVLEGFKEKGKAKALGVDSELTGTNNSNEGEEEERGKEIIELEDLEEETVVPKTPIAGPLCQTLKPVVLVSSMPKPISKPIVALASPVAGPSTAQMVPSSAPKPAATMPASKPVPVKSASKPAIKGGFIFKDPFMVRQFKLAGTKESSALIINQATEVAATQETLRDEDTSGEDENNKDSNDNKCSKGDDDDSNNKSDAAMDVDSGRRPEETRPMAPTKTTVTEVVAPVP
ncbi:hypothetical protein C0995_005690, partial [Termitomyces sp. Mi166